MAILRLLPWVTSPPAGFVACNHSMRSRSDAMFRRRLYRPV